MARMSSTLLDTNDIFPELDLQLVSGEKVKLPEETGEGYGVFLFTLPALRNACPIECGAYSIGAKPIPLGSAKRNKKQLSVNSLPC